MSEGFGFVEAKEIVNHIDEVKGNNHVSNLEWCTQKRKLNHGTARQRLREKLGRIR
ncbi:HNH endonuclease [Staphylococcus cohnii]|uniref:HNH endonuclease n=1 Tax=Staphylococcus cohnii TaxID=29382 RepID=UPI003CEB785E